MVDFTHVGGQIHAAYHALSREGDESRILRGLEKDQSALEIGLGLHVHLKLACAGDTSEGREGRQASEIFLTSNSNVGMTLCSSRERGR